MTESNNHIKARVVSVVPHEVSITSWRVEEKSCEDVEKGWRSTGGLLELLVVVPLAQSRAHTLQVRHTFRDLLDGLNLLFQELRLDEVTHLKTQVKHLKMQVTLKHMSHIRKHKSHI